MNFTRIFAVLAAPAMLTLAACGGSTATIANATGNTANVRVLNAVPGGSAVDVYFQTTGSAAPSAPIVKDITYGVNSDYLTEPAAAATLIAQTANGAAPSTGTPQLTACPLPALSNNGKYSVVIATINGAVNCYLFQDADFTSAPQYRFHNASSASPANLQYGTIASSNAPLATQFSVQGVAGRGISSNTGLTQVGAVAAPTAATSISFAAGGGTGNVASNDTALATLDSSKIFGPNALTQPDTSGVLNATGTAGTSVFAIDCTTAAVSTLPGVSCTNGYALVGYTDSK